ncbi:hypothetical protein BDZ45DRAFT_754530 [Acephala macrosclerotiorum]|nr:hypothetical protein BDZ45DRAFT_754530 [Acephala macrosclerotiorum]
MAYGNEMGQGVPWKEPIGHYDLKSDNIIIGSRDVDHVEQEIVKAWVFQSYQENLPMNSGQSSAQEARNHIIPLNNLTAVPLTEPLAPAVTSDQRRIPEVHLQEKVQYLPFRLSYFSVDLSVTNHQLISAQSLDYHKAPSV